LLTFSPSQIFIMPPIRSTRGRAPAWTRLHGKYSFEFEGKSVAVIFCKSIPTVEQWQPFSTQDLPRMTAFFLLSYKAVEIEPDLPDELPGAVLASDKFFDSGPKTAAKVYGVTLREIRQFKFQASRLYSKFFFKKSSHWRAESSRRKDFITAFSERLARSGKEELQPAASVEDGPVGDDGADGSYAVGENSTEKEAMRDGVPEGGEGGEGISNRDEVSRLAKRPRRKKDRKPLLGRGATVHRRDIGEYIDHKCWARCRVKLKGRYTQEREQECRDELNIIVHKIKSGNAWSAYGEGHERLRKSYKRCEKDGIAAILIASAVVENWKTPTERKRWGEIEREKRQMAWQQMNDDILEERVSLSSE
jgi:hypothetical protein